ncbi:PLP-dependent aminotransferase family protein [Vibrio palustris]|uniref:Putative HTH-type transcriptional regulator YdcR n=1 Tax=Vibrio palustris TaxID=1918946 RepID=A0A1R4B7T2_9VIBR|nr:PLP-dependent aminotransferase family protein [Vibrio palustris]SJL84975.1 putative HTH-type transcriptional regulator YdcR [Vibrio palustris]
MSTSKFVHIAATIEKKIDNGEYQPNSKLPTHRLLADELGTTPATVAKAYKLLNDKGCVESFIGKGTFVRGHSELDQAIQAPEDDEHHYNFSLLQPCLSKNLPALKHAYRESADQLTNSLIGYTEYTGHESHRAAGVKWAQQYGLQGGNTSNTLLTNGAQHALSLLIDSLSQPGDTLLVDELTYPGILAIASMSGRQVVGVTLDEHGLCPHALTAAIDEHHPALVITIPRHQNPTGLSMPEWRKKAIAEVINQTHTWLIEDDIYGFLDEQTVAPIANFAPDYTFHISALSKAISPAMRCGYLKVPNGQVALLQAHIRANMWLSSPINFIAATQLIESGKAFNLAAEQRETAQERQKIARSILTAVTCHASGYHIWLPLPSQWQPDRFTLEAKNRGIIVTSGSYFCANGEQTPHVRLSLMAINSEQRLISGLQALQNLLTTDMNSFFPG